MLKANGSMNGASVKLGILFSKAGISPNSWTIIALIPAFAGFICLLYGQLLSGALFFILSGLMDAIDGAVARVTGAVSNFGAFLDGVIDRYVEILLYLGLMYYLLNYMAVSFLIPNVFWIAVLIFGALMGTFVRAYADHKMVVTDQKKLKVMGGILERAERLGIVFAGMIFGYFNPVYLVYLISVAAVLSNLTTLQRIAAVSRLKE